MDTTIILTAIATGATLALKDTASQAVKDAYRGLRALLVERFGVASIETLEKDPDDEDFRRSVAKELGLTKELMKEPTVLELIDRLYIAIEENNSAEDLESVGVDVVRIKSERNTVIKGIEGFTKGLKSDEIVSGQDTRIEGVSSKK